VKSFKNPTCFLCGNESDFSQLFPKFCSTHNYLCNKCGLVFIPRGNNYLENYYMKDGYFKKSPNLSARSRFVSRSMFRSLGRAHINKILSKLNIDIFGKRVIDIGCGYGENLYVLRELYKCDVYGLEPSKEASSLGKKMFGIDIINTSLEAFSDRGVKYDVIICSHVLEHVADPVVFINKAIKLLGENGLFYIEVPNILKPSGGFSLTNFLYYEHLQNFSAHTLKLLIEKCGCSVVAYSDSDFLCFVVSKDPRRQNNAVSISVIKPEEVLSFLNRYKQDYSILNSIGVFLKKILYLIKLLFSKFVLDVFSKK